MSASVECRRDERGLLVVHLLCFGESGPVAFRPRVEPRLVVNSMEMLVRAAHGGVGICTIQNLAVADDVAAGALKRVLPGFELRGGGLYVLYPSSRLLSPKVRVFVEHVVQAGRRSYDHA